MKQSVLIVIGLALMGLVSCKDDEPKVDPIVGVWELDDVSMSISQPDFEYAEFEGENNLYGESSYTIEFKADLSYEREINDIPGFGDHSEEGTWEIDGEDLDLDSEDDEVGGVAYSFQIVEKTGTNLILTYEEAQSLFPSAKISEWFTDGTLDEDGYFTVTEEQYDSLVANFAQSVDATFTFEFDKQ